MRIVGLTGGIASGKSTVSRMLVELGVRVVDIDAIARQVVAPGEPAWREVVDWLGRPYLLADGNLDRRKVADLVFADSSARARLEAIIHPRIAEIVDREVAAARAEGLKALVLDVPLLFEAGWADRVDEVWVVYADDETRLKRLQERDKVAFPQALINHEVLFFEWPDIVELDFKNTFHEGVDIIGRPQDLPFYAVVLAIEKKTSVVVFIRLLHLGEKSFLSQFFFDYLQGFRELRAFILGRAENITGYRLDNIVVDELFEQASPVDLTAVFLFDQCEHLADLGNQKRMLAHGSALMHELSRPAPHVV